ncbi:MAG: SDR family NAD(P)-dependent oxidoreductase, partial [Acidobacteria bacterium]|nr:SDR family NAD(P)-dependent oxidoreductase [Acidobacteriota bacterium]
MERLREGSPADPGRLLLGRVSSKNPSRSSKRRRGPGEPGRFPRPHQSATAAREPQTAAEQGRNAAPSEPAGLPRGGARDGSGTSQVPAAEVAEEIQAMGGAAVPNTDDVSDWEGARRLVQTALDSFGRLDALVNNAGILRDRMLFNMEPEEWDSVIRVHLRGTFSPSRHAVNYWRDLAKAGKPVDARIINTSS